MNGSTLASMRAPEWVSEFESLVRSIIVHAEDLLNMVRYGATKGKNDRRTAVIREQSLEALRKAQLALTGAETVVGARARLVRAVEVACEDVGTGETPSRAALRALRTLAEFAPALARDIQRSTRARQRFHLAVASRHDGLPKLPKDKGMAEKYESVSAYPENALAPWLVHLAAALAAATGDRVAPAVLDKGYRDWLRKHPEEGDLKRGRPRRGSRAVKTR